MTESTERQLMDKLVEASFQITGMLTRAASGNDMSLTQLRMIAILRDRRPRMADLADFLGLDRSTVSGLIDRAAKRGLVERVASEDDGRSTRVALTAAGQTLSARVADDVAASVSTLTGKISESDRAVLLGLVTALVARPEP